MPSTLACLGLTVDSAAALDALLERLPAEDHGRGGGGVRILRHVDAGSGARVVVGVRDGDAVDVVASLDGPVGALLGRLRADDGVVTADVLDPDSDETVTRLVADLEQLRCLPSTEAAHGIPDDVQFPASVVALGVDVTVHADGAAFASSDQGRDGDGPGFAAESFVSHGLVDGAGPEPTAWLAGTVLHTDTLTTEATGETFHAVQVRTEGFTATVCLPAADGAEAPTSGNVVAGTCWMVLDVPALWSLDVGSLTDLVPTRRRWFRRRSGS